MKRLSILLSLALVLAFSVGAMASLSTNITGWVETDLVYKKDNPIEQPENPMYLQARMRGRVQLTMGSTNNANPKVTISMATAANETAWINLKDALTRNTNMTFNISGINMVATGPLWKNGPELTTTIGSTNRNWSHYGAYRLGRNIIEVDGLSVGPVKVTGLYAYTQAEARYNKAAGNTAALRLSGTINPITFNAYVTNYGPQTDADNRHNNFAVDAKMSPVAGVDLSGVFGYDGKNEGMTYKAEATIKTIENFTITGLVRATDDKYNPAHTDTNANARQWWPNEQVYKVTAATNQGGVDLSGSFQRATNYAGENATNTIEGKASTTIAGLGNGLKVGGTVTVTNKPDNTSTTKTVLDASTTVSTVTLTYKGTIETDKEMVNDIKAETKLNLPFADNVTLLGQVIFDENQAKDHHKLKYGARLNWRLPNEMDIWVGYANFNMSGNDWVNGTGDDGFYIRVHRRMNL